MQWHGVIAQQGKKMDIHCKFCGEPMDHDALHDAFDWERDTPISYKDAARRFAKYGCGYETQTRCHHSMVDADSAMKASALQILSDHPEEWII